MDIEKFLVDLITLKKEIIEANLTVYEYDDTDIVKLEIASDEFKGTFQDYDHFSALKKLRLELEKENLLIRCYGSAISVQPSAMQFSMGNTRNAYKMIIGKQAHNKDLVDIFQECDLDILSTVEEQDFYFKQWIDYFRNGL